MSSVSTLGRLPGNGKQSMNNPCNVDGEKLETKEYKDTVFYRQSLQYKDTVFYRQPLQYYDTVFYRQSLQYKDSLFYQQSRQCGQR